MEHSKEYYQSFVTFLQTACNSQQRDYPYDKGIEIVGDYWMAICRYLKEQGLARVNYGELHIYQFPPLLPIIADCKHMIEAMDKAESDRNVDRKYKIKGILYGRVSLIVSILAFLFSLFVWLKQSAIF